MSRSLNRVELLGHLGKDADVRFTPSGIQIGQFSIATSRRWKDKRTGEWKEETDWHRCVLWRCENLANFLQKGKQVFVSGRLQTRDYQDRDGVKRYATEVIVDELILLGGGQAAQGQTASAPAPGAPPLESGEHSITDDDVPF